MYLVSGPQGSRVVLDGRPVLLLCSGNALGLADHPRVREAAADAAMRWGVGAGASRLGSGTMTVHRRLEQRLADQHDTDAALLFGSGYLAGLGVLQALAGTGDVVFTDELNHASIADGCRLARAGGVVVYRHGDAEHLAWSIARAGGRRGVIVTESVFALDGDVAPLFDLADLAHEHRLRLVVDEAHALGTTGPDGRGVVAELQLEDEVDVVLGSLGTALGSYGGYAACDRPTARAIAGAARSLASSTAPPPPAMAGALAALELLLEQPRRVDKLQANARVLRDALAREGFDVAGSSTQIVPLVAGDAETAVRLHEEALADGVFAQAVVPPDVPDGTARLRLTVMASHTKPELRDAARVLGRAALRAGFRPDAALPVAAAHQGTDEFGALPAAEAA
jgi:glycine C-acetyltransferase/8-amino-7-oxononanoate synthase